MEETTGSVVVSSNGFFTESLAPNERFEAWRHHVGSYFGRADVSRYARGSFSGSLTATQVGRISVGVQTSSSMLFERTWKHISHQDGDYVLLAIVRKGSAMLEHLGRRSRLMPGDLVIADFRQPLRWVCQGPFEEALLKIDCELFEHRFSRMREYAGIAFPQKSSLFSSMANYLMAVADQAHARTQDVLALHALEVLAIALDEPLSRMSPSHGMLLRIQRYIENNLSDPQLSPMSIALQHRISRRHLYRLFADVDGAVAGYIRHRRLIRSKDILAPRANARQTIAEIAFGIGFGDVTTFDRAFRSLFGMSPREYRTAARDAVGYMDKSGKDIEVTD